MISFRATDDVDGDGDDWGWDEPSEEGDIELAGSSDQSIPHPSSLSLSPNNAHHLLRKET